MKQIEVMIMGQSYLLGCPEGGEPRLREAVDKVDAAMCRIRDAGKIKARDRIAVLAALNLAFDAADRAAAAAGAQASQPPQAPPVQQAPPAETAAHAANDPADDARVAHLVQRIDQALAGDGRLF